MECRDARELLTAHVDGELRGREALDVARHVEDCAGCAATAARLTAMRRAVGGDATRFRASSALVQRVQASLAPASSREMAPAVAFWRRLAIAGAFATAIAAAWGVGLVLTRPSADDAVVDELVASHVRSLLSGRAVDVASSDRHTVKPWFAGKVDYSPPVTDLAADGFPLVGGRVDYVQGRTATALVYRRNQHVIDLYVLPEGEGAAGSGVTADSRQGFHVLHWARGGMSYWAVSDVEPAELARFREALSARD